MDSSPFPLSPSSASSAESRCPFARAARLITPCGPIESTMLLGTTIIPPFCFNPS